MAATGESVEERRMSQYIQVFITIDSEDNAKKLQQALVEQRAAACVQVLGPISSVYWWEGKIEDTKEWICLAKTEAQQYSRLESLVRENHPYGVPEILAMPVLTGNREYLDWLKAETRV
jgi:periplasmic divalent cation tolerance protein